MKINGQPIERYGATKLTVEIQPAQDAVAVEWLDRSAAPTIREATQKCGTAKVVLYFRGTDPGKIEQSIAELMALLTGETILDIPDRRGQYVGYLQKSKIEPVAKSKTRRKLVLDFQGYLRGAQKQSKSYHGVTAAKLRRLGARPAPATVIVTPDLDMETFTLSGLTDNGPITIKNLTGTVPVIIDGRDGTAWESGLSKGEDVDLWEPPTLRTDEARLRFSSPAVKVTVEYWPIWL